MKRDHQVHHVGLPFYKLRAMVIVILLTSCSFAATTQPKSTIILPTQDPKSPDAILSNSRQALLSVKSYRMTSVWTRSVGSPTEEHIVFVAPDRYQSKMPGICPNGVEWESLQIGKTSYSRCPPNAWRSAQMGLDPPHIRLVNTYWDHAKSIGSVRREAIGANTFLRIDAEYSRPYNGKMETGKLSFLIDERTLLPYKLDIDMVYQDLRSIGNIEFSEFNLPMTIPDPVLE